MKLVQFMNTEPNWRKILQAPPYNIKITDSYADDGARHYTIMKYNQLSSDFNEEMVREARGSIFYQEPYTGVWECVCHPFEKFGNYGESYVPQIDWETARVQEKVDGSLIKIWYHGGWHISTNGTVDARYAMTQDGKTSYYDLVLRALKEHGAVDKFFKALYRDVTYMFELVSPDNRMTVPYNETRLYLIGARDNEQDYELDPEWLHRVFEFKVPGMIKIPKSYPLQTLEDCIAAVEAMGADEEGFVVCDTLFNRVKVKSPAYLYASHLRFNNSITTKKVIKIIREGCLDDFLAYSDDYAPTVQAIMDAGRAICAEMENDWKIFKAMNFSNKALFFKAVQSSPYRDYLCKKYDNKYPLTAKDWLDRQSLDNITNMVEGELE
jgi:hypothetical protein